MYIYYYCFFPCLLFFLPRLTFFSSLRASSLASGGRGEEKVWGRVIRFCPEETQLIIFSAAPKFVSGGAKKRKGARRGEKKREEKGSKDCKWFW